LSGFAPGLPLAGYLVVLGAQRAAELWWSRRNLALLRARGGRESGAGHFPLFIFLHTAYPVALVAEVVRGARPPALWPAWLALWLAAQVLRLATMRALGERWNVRVVVLPGQPPVRSGPYRWLAHPNYVAVALEFVAAPMLFGAWRTALAASIVNAAVLAVRIPAEERALRDAQPPRA
jgi:methyltransferase